MTAALYKSSITLNDKTGLPAEYHSLIAAYEPLVATVARRVGIPEQYIADACHEVQLKFFTKNGLDMFDPERGTRFATLYRNWCALFMLQERDKVIKYTNRVTLTEPHGDHHPFDRTEPDLADDITSNAAVMEWVSRAETALTAAGYETLVPLLHKCVEAAAANRKLTRDEIAAATGTKQTQSSNTMAKLRRVLTKTGLGAESIGSL